MFSSLFYIETQKQERMKIRIQETKTPQFSKMHYTDLILDIINEFH